MHLGLMKIITPEKSTGKHPDCQIKIHYPPALPIVSKKDEIRNAILQNHVVIISGETGSGKSTQISKICLEAGRGIKGKIACTQPRRIAAITIAHRLAEELGEGVGQTVGYKIRFEEKLTQQTTIKIMTDGMLLAETQHDPLLRQYDTIIVDEAHERSVNIDFILGILQTLLKRRKDLKVIITSATLDTEKFSRAFHNAPIIEVSGRMYQVSLRYRPLDKDLEEKGDLTYIDAAIAAVDDLLIGESNGDILVFMPTEQDIRECCEILKGRNYEHTQILPLFARLSWADQRKVFQATSRKVIVATNIAETSLTIPGVRFVVDTGLARVLRYNPRTGTTSLPILPVSKSSADQRKGRCGRVQDGVCIRLYSEAYYQTRVAFNTPEILRSNLAGVILKMLSLNLPDIHLFPFIDKPSGKAIKDGFDLLYELGAISRAGKNSQGAATCQLTEQGRLMALLPIDPRVARMIIEGRREKCLHEIIVIASALSIQDPRERPAEKEKMADNAHRILKNNQSDFLTLLNIWQHYGNTWETFQTQNKMRKFCRDHFLSYRRMREWQDIYQQIVNILKQDNGYKNDLCSSYTAGYNQETLVLPEIPDDNLRYAAIHKSILSGYLSHIAQKNEKKSFTAIREKEVFIFPGSSLFQKSGKWIVAAEYIETSKLYARTVAHIDPDWLEKLGGHLCKRKYFDPHWDREKGEVKAFMQVSLFGFIIEPRRLVSYGQIDPKVGAEIFFEALVEGEISQKLSFLIHNLNLMERIKGYEEKIRKRDLLVNREKQIDFYRSRIPRIASVRALQKFIFEKGSDAFLIMKEEDLLANNIHPTDIDTDYPDIVQYGNIALPLSYTFDPGSDKDGVTLKVPINALAGIAYDIVDWSIPGLQEGRVLGLLKGLPKEYRKRLHPIKEKAGEILSRMEEKQGKDFLPTLSGFIKAEFGVDIPLTAWSLDNLDQHLRMRYEIVDETGNALTASRDLKVLFAQVINEMENTALEEAKDKWEKHHLTSFDLIDLPEKIPFEFQGQAKGYFYPAMIDQGSSCSVKLFKDPFEAAKEHKKGMIRCYALQINDRIKNLKRTLTLNRELMFYLNQMGDTKRRISHIIDKVILNVYDLKSREYISFTESLDRDGKKFSIEALGLEKNIVTVLQYYDDTCRMIKNLEATNRKSPAVLSYLTERQKELNDLLPPDFLIDLKAEDFLHLVRYIKASRVRVERGVLNLERDRLKDMEVLEFVEAYKGLMFDNGLLCSARKRAAISELSKMIQEYKVSVFAQEVRTAIPVSRKRLTDKIKEIKEMA
jgi:ATP-dependent helicase HrpA